MNQEIERIDLEIESIEILSKKLILEADINLGLLSELVQVMDKRIAELLYVKDHILSWDDPKDNILDLKINRSSSVFIRSKTDGEWISVCSIELLEKGQIFTTKAGRETGEEYKFCSMVVGENSMFFNVKVEKKQG